MARLSDWAKEFAEVVAIHLQALDQRLELLTKQPGSTFAEDIERIKKTRERLMKAIADAAPGGLQTAGMQGLDGASAAKVDALGVEVDAVTHALVEWQETGHWPPLTIKPSKPPRDETANEWEQTAKIAGDDDVKREGRQPDAGQRFLKTTTGKVVAGGALVLLARWILR